MWKWLRRVIAAIVATILIAIAIPIAGLAYGFLTTDSITIGHPPPPEAAAQAISARLAGEIDGYKRPEESTFLTYPEWAIVYAAREYAGFVADAPPAAFPYWAYIGRFWRDYALMIRATQAYPFNFQNHLMLMVIGVSHTVEHAVQWAYENTAGRLSGLAAGFRPVAEDEYQAAVAAEYAAFLDQVPWYAFPYADKRAGLWAVETADGMPAIRSWERKLGFGLAYTVKQGYADLIRSGLDATSDGALLDIHVWAQGPVANAIAGEPDTAIAKDLGAAGAVFVTKRYQVFTDMIPRLIDKGVRFVEIGGNRLIFLTLRFEGDIEPVDGAHQVFGYRISALPNGRRAGFAVPVARLHEILTEFTDNGARLEHVYDY